MKQYIKKIIKHFIAFDHIDFSKAFSKAPLYLIGLLLLVSKMEIKAQTLSPSVSPACGAYFSASNGSLSSTFGEAVITTLSSSNNKLTQGFQQPEVQIKTGIITGTYCAGATVNVPFTATGIIGNTNVFTAQLSNASGSFASPINIGTVIGNASGTIIATIPLTTPIGSAYRIRVKSSLPNFIGPDNGTNIGVITGCFVSLNLTLFLEGYYLGSNAMEPVLLNQIGLGSNLITDNINVELHPASNPSTVITAPSVLLFTNGTASVNFAAAAGNYYIGIKHRNTVETWSANPIALSAVPTSYNFSTASSQAYGNNMVEVEPNVWALYTGDVNQDENADLLDLSLLDNDVSAFLFGYFPTDLNGDGNVDLLDSPILEANVNAFVFAAHP